MAAYVCVIRIGEKQLRQQLSIIFTALLNLFKHNTLMVLLSSFNKEIAET